jgi:tRNA nucleotidyltransferase/poly(A) polymerase
MVLSWIFKRGQPQLPKNFRNSIDPEALKIIEKLQKAGHESYLVGGCVRDILLGKKPKDFDIATQATPHQVKALIHRSFIIGRRFRIVVAKRNERNLSISNSGKTENLFPSSIEKTPEKEFQITTFRREPVVVDGVINENVFGNPKEDALRRDFTINALFLDPTKAKIVDFVDGLKDLQNRKLRIIGDPEVRFPEDSIRIFRALRFKTRSGLKFEEATWKTMKSHSDELALAKRERVREEFLKILREGHLKEVFSHFEEMHLWKHISPSLAKIYSGSHSDHKFLSKLSLALESVPWTHSSQAPLIFLISWPLNPASADKKYHSLPSINSFFEEIRVSKAEQEDMERIQANLLRIKKDPEAQQATRLLIRNTRFFAHQVQTFYCLKILADCFPQEYGELWKTWGPIWKKHVQDYIAGTLQTLAQSSGHEKRSPARGSSVRRRGRRGPTRRGSTSSSGTGEIS